MAVGDLRNDLGDMPVRVPARGRTKRAQRTQPEGCSSSSL